ncbi:MAG: NAD-dependent dehydratase, partial [Pseudomonadota bacterium]
MTETHRVRDLAKIVADMTRAEILNVPNPRKEADENELIVRNDQFLQLGLKPITLAEGLLKEVIDVAEKYAHRIDRSRIPAVSAWTKDIAKRVVHDPTKRDLKVVGAE